MSRTSRSRPFVQRPTALECPPALLHRFNLTQFVSRFNAQRVAAMSKVGLLYCLVRMEGRGLCVRCECSRPPAPRVHRFDATMQQSSTVARFAQNNAALREPAKHRKGASKIHFAWSTAETCKSSHVARDVTKRATTHVCKCFIPRAFQTIDALRQFVGTVDVQTVESIDVCKRIVSNNLHATR